MAKLTVVISFLKEIVKRYFMIIFFPLVSFFAFTSFGILKLLGPILFQLLCIHCKTMVSFSICTIMDIAVVFPDHLSDI